MNGSTSIGRLGTPSDKGVLWFLECRTDTNLIPDSAKNASMPGLRSKSHVIKWNKNDFDKRLPRTVSLWTWVIVKCACHLPVLLNISSGSTILAKDGALGSEATSTPADRRAAQDESFMSQYVTYILRGMEGQRG
jgi:hypothetical protein